MNRFEYYIVEAGNEESSQNVDIQYFEFAEFLMRLLEIPYVCALSNDKKDQVLAYGPRIEDYGK